MLDKIDKKTILILCLIVVILLLAVLFGWHIIRPVLDPVAWDMTKIFLCGAGCGLLLGIWIGRKIEPAIKKDEATIKKDETTLRKDEEKLKKDI